VNAIIRFLAGGVLALAIGTLGAPAHAAGLLPPLPTAPEGDIPGVNDWNCKPTAERPTPVILVHGTIGDRRHLLEMLGKTIKAKGFCVFSIDYGNRGLDDIVGSAEQLKAYVQKVLEATGASQVSMVGHSQGGMMPRYYIKFLGGDKYVDDLVGIAPSNHGTKVIPGKNPIAPLLPGLICMSCNQQVWGSEFLANLNADDETPGDVSYTQIETALDEVVVPYTSAFLTPGPNTTNITLQAKCPLTVAEHILIPTIPSTIGWTLDALTHDGPANPNFKPTC
jgi:triacylglycerol esterase/lipase EstA (alpha/beta hydrolase family)